MQVTKEDFDNAVKQNRSADTCLIAQTMIRHNLSPITWSWVDFIVEHPVGLKLRVRFDCYFRRCGDETTTPLKELRASLPIEI